jgi:hypothetical protein
MDIEPEKPEKQKDEDFDQYDPELDTNPNMRDQLAMNEHSIPIFDSQADLANFLGIPMNKLNKKKDGPYIMAKWRYACADAMLWARKQPKHQR